MKTNDELDKENGKHYSIFSRNEQSKIDLSIESLQDHDADLTVKHYSLLMYNLVVGDAIRYITLLHSKNDYVKMTHFVKMTYCQGNKSMLLLHTSSYYNKVMLH